MKMPELLKQAGVTFVEDGEHHHARYGWVNLDCPCCSPGTGAFRMGWNLFGRYFNCWSCGPQKTIRTLAEILGCTEKVAYSQLGGIEVDEYYRQVEERTGKYEVPPDVGKLKKPHREYLRDRGFEPTVLEMNWGIKGFAECGGRYAWRVFVPVRLNQEDVTWTARAITDDARLRYESAPREMEKFNIKKVLYGEDHAHHKIALVEGCTGVWKIGPGAVGIMGLSYTRAQLLRIAHYDKVYVCFDPDAAGQKRAQTICNELAALHGKVTNLILETGDPGNCEEWELKQVRKLLV